MKNKPGLLWYEPDHKKPWAKRISEASAHMLSKYGRTVTTVFLPPGVVAETELKTVNRPLQTNHLILE